MNLKEIKKIQIQIKQIFFHHQNKIRSRQLKEAIKIHNKILKSKIIGKQKVCWIKMEYKIMEQHQLACKMGQLETLSNNYLIITKISNNCIILKWLQLQVQTELKLLNKM